MTSITSITRINLATSPSLHRHRLIRPPMLSSLHNRASHYPILNLSSYLFLRVQSLTCKSVSLSGRRSNASRHPHSRWQHTSASSLTSLPTLRPSLGREAGLRSESPLSLTSEVKYAMKLSGRSLTSSTWMTISGLWTRLRVGNHRALR